MKATTLFLGVLCSMFLSAQVELKQWNDSMNALKKAGKLNGTEKMFNVVNKGYQNPLKVTPNTPGVQSTTCDCWVQRDSSWLVAPMNGSGGSGGPGVPPDYRNDDWSTPLINLPFSFCLYGTNYTSCYLNNNGNVSFGAPYSTFTANSFPDPSFVMVAPFWADVDTRNLQSGLVYYKLTPTHLIVQWENVGYYNQWADKLNTFQLIMTNGTDPILPSGNVSFCYKDMQWTTGDASGGTNGFGGSPATVGANKGDGINYLQFGLFDQAGTTYDGAYGNNDGVDWLDNQSFFLNTCAMGNNVAPVPSGISNCDTTKLCLGDTIQYTYTFMSPEQAQTTTISATSTFPSGFSVVSNTPGNNATITIQIIPPASGVYSVALTATDNGTPSATTVVTLFFDITQFTSPLPTITGPTGYCTGGQGVNLTCGPGPYGSYLWSNGATTAGINNVTAGTYSCTVESNGCYKTVTYTVTQYPNPTPTLVPPPAACGSVLDTIFVTGNYSSYQWSNGATTSYIIVGPGTYSVIVTDANGCTGSSTSVTLSPAAAPLAAYSYTPSQSVILGNSLNFSDLSSILNGTIVSWYWSFGDGGNSMVANPVHTYLNPGTYTVCLTVSTATPCSDSICKVFEVLPLDILPLNIFTPNGDGDNDLMVFQNLEYFPDNYLEVYNRWGNLVYSKVGYKNDWNAHEVSDGVYYYMLKVEGKEKPLTGYVHIYR